VPKSQLDTLISHLVAAKRSLSSIYHVSRANEIVNTARSALEESVIVSARTGFLRRGQKNQIRLLYNVRAEIENISHRGRAEFASVLKELDAADDRLKETLDTLRQTVVHPSFRPEGEEPKSLHDFVDERGVEELETVLKGAIDRTKTAQTQLDSSSYAFDEELRSLQEALGRYRTAMELVSSRSSASTSTSSPAASNAALSSPSSIPAMLRSLESHAQEMADLLESLVHHFDRCVTAVKHTEGGGAAARSITGDMPTGVNVGVQLGDDIQDGSDTNINDPLEPMTEEDYQEMLEVLNKDAAEAEDVVLEIQDRIAEMESIQENVLAQRDDLVSICNATTDIFEHLSSLSSTRLPEFIAQAHTFTQIWNEEYERIRAGMVDLSDLRSLYVGFLDAYDGLILEVARRKHVRQGVERILREARAKLEQLYEEDVNAREAFRVEQGDYLPSDIWPGLGRGPMKVKFIRVSGDKLEGSAEQVENELSEESKGAIIADESTDGGDYIPDLPKQVVEDAITRLKARAKGPLI
jgi:autophagy-related protein 17